MNKILFSSLLIALFVGMNSIAQPTQAYYSSILGKVSMTFPDKFSVSKQDNEEENYIIVKTQAVVDGVVYILSYAVHTNALTEHDRLNQLSLNTFLDSVGGTISKKESWKKDNNRGLKALFEMANNSMKGEYRVILKDKIQYQIAAVGPYQSWNQEKVANFMNSFELKE